MKKEKTIVKKSKFSKMESDEDEIDSIEQDEDFTQSVDPDKEYFIFEENRFLCSEKGYNSDSEVLKIDAEKNN
jgi:hypothetical protein